VAAASTVTTATAMTTSMAPTHPSSAATHPGATTVNGNAVSRAATAAKTSVAMTPAVPAMPARPATPSEAAAHRIAAPVESRPAPAVIVPAIIPSPEDELDLFHVRWGDNRKEAGGQRAGRAGHTEHRERKRYASRVNPTSHVCLHPLNVPNGEAPVPKNRDNASAQRLFPSGAEFPLVDPDAEDAAAGWLAGLLYNHFGYYGSRSPPVSARTFSIC
jgi:hypothetical protein